MDDLKFPFEIIESCYLSTAYNQQISYRLLQESLISVYESNDESVFSKIFGWIKKKMQDFVSLIKKWVAAIVKFLTQTIPNFLKRMLKKIKSFIDRLFGKSKTIELEKNVSIQEKKRIENTVNKANVVTKETVLKKADKESKTETPDGKEINKDANLGSKSKKDEEIKFSSNDDIAEKRKSVKKDIDKINGEKVKEDINSAFNNEELIFVSKEQEEQAHYTMCKDIFNDVLVSMKTIVNICKSRETVLSACINALNDIIQNDVEFKNSDSIGDIFGNMDNETKEKITNMINTKYYQSTNYYSKKNQYFYFENLEKKDMAKFKLEDLNKQMERFVNDKTGDEIAKNATMQAKKVIDLSSKIVSTYDKTEHAEKAKEIVESFGRIQEAMYKFLTSAAEDYNNFITYTVRTITNALEYTEE